MKNEIKYVAESILKDAAGRGVLNAIVPVSWKDLNDSQLRYVFYLLSENYPKEKVMQLALLNLGMVRNSAGRYVSLSLYSRFISAESLAAEAKKMEYLTHIPDYPVRLSRIGNRDAIDAYCETLSFESYLAIDNYFIGYLNTKNIDLLYVVSGRLYPDKETAGNPIDPDMFGGKEAANILVWWTGLKNRLNREYPYIMTAAPVEGEDVPAPTYQDLRDNMDRMLFALTGGDPTKEKAVLAMPYRRALAYLNEIARKTKEKK